MSLKNGVIKPIKIKGGKILYNPPSYECAFCDYLVASQKALKLHMKYTHQKIYKESGERSFRCRICDLKFSTEKENIDHSRKTGH